MSLLSQPHLARTGLTLLALGLGVSPSLAKPISDDSDVNPGGPWLVSSTSQIPDNAGLIDGCDAALVRVEPDSQPFVQTSLAGWLALTGFQPSDIDGFAFRPGAQSRGHRSSMAFSLLSNEAGFRDGDVLGVAPGGGAEVLVSEDALLGILGVPLGSIDLDGIAYDDQGRLLFSLQGFLAGTVVGDVENGDILRVEPDGGLSRSYTEDQVQGAFVQATGQADLIGDVHGIEFLGGELHVTLQSPSSFDGAVLRLGAQPGFLMTEDSLGLQGAELDAIAYMGLNVSSPAIATSEATSPAGGTIAGQGRGFHPGGLVLVLPAGSQALGPDLGLGGFGELCVDPMDPLLNALLQVDALPMFLADGTGAFNIDFALPSASDAGLFGIGMGWTYQAIDLTDFSATAPLRVALP